MEVMVLGEIDFFFAVIVKESVLLLSARLAAIIVAVPLEPTIVTVTCLLSVPLGLPSRPCC